MEEWKSLDFLGYPKYSISNYGQIKGSQGIRKASEDRDGYKNIRLYSHNKGTNFKISRLVALAFIPTDDITLQVDHKDKDRSNNHADNLQWLTPKKNTQRSNKSTISIDIANAIRKEYQPYKEGHNMPALMTKYNVSYNMIQNILYNKCWLE